MVINYQYTFDDYREGLDEVNRLQREANQKKARAKRSGITAIVAVVSFGVFIAVQFIWPHEAGLAVLHALLDIVIFAFAMAVIAVRNAIRSGRRLITFRSTSRIIVLVLAFSPGIVLLAFKARNFTFVDDFILPHAGIMVFALMIVIITFRTTANRQKKSWDENMWLHLPKSADISVDGITLSDSSSRTAWQWTGFVRAEETKNLFIFFISPSNFQMIPKRAFESEEQLAAMRAMMRLADGSRTGGFPVNLPSSAASALTEISQ